MVMWGFVERVGDPIPLIAQDGSAHRGDALTADALESTGPRRRRRNATASDPHHDRGPGVLGARGARRTSRCPSVQAGPARRRRTPRVDLRCRGRAGRPGDRARSAVHRRRRAVRLRRQRHHHRAGRRGARDCSPSARCCGTGTCPASRSTRRVLNHVLAGLADADDADPAGTAAVGSLTRLRGECRAAKERLSAETATIIPVELPGSVSDVRVTRAELESLLDRPLAGFLDALGDTLERNRIPVASLSAVATVGGGAAIPLDHPATVRTAAGPHRHAARNPGLAAATGAAVLAGLGRIRRRSDRTGARRRDFPTGLATAAWAAGAAGAAATQSATDGSPSATYRALAWSQDDEPAGEPVPYSGEDYTFDPHQGATSARSAGGVRARRPTSTRPPIPRRCPGTSARRCCSVPPRPRPAGRRRPGRHADLQSTAPRDR